MRRIPNVSRKNRMEACRTCPHFDSYNVSCGPLIKGATIMHGAEQINLCGCRMDIKTWLGWARCPIGRWEMVGTTDMHLQDAEAFLREIDGKRTITDAKKFVAIWKSVYGGEVPAIGCSSCVPQLMKELKQTIASWKEMKSDQ